MMFGRVRPTQNEFLRMWAVEVFTVSELSDKPFGAIVKKQVKTSKKISKEVSKGAMPPSGFFR